MAAVAVDGGDELVRPSSRSSGEKGESDQRRRGSVRGFVHVSWASREGPGKEEADREVATAITHASTRLCLLAEVEDDRFALVGWASAKVPGQLGCQVSQVGFSLSLLHFYFRFSFLLFCSL